MKAAVYHEFSGPINYRSVPKPTLTSPTSIVVQVMATGVCRSDWHGWKGHDSDIKDHGLPFIPGHELSGIVNQIGSSVSKVKLGDRIAIPFILSCGSCVECDRSKPTVCLHQAQPGFTILGSFAEYVEIPRADRNVRVLPDNVSFVEAAALGCRFTTAYRAVVQQGLGIICSSSSSQEPSKGDGDGDGDGKTICIFGCGGLGLSCVMIAKAFQNEGNVKSIIAVDVSQQALDKALELGADHIVNASAFAPPLGLGTISKKGKDHDQDHLVRQRVLELTHGWGAELTIDAGGFASTCENAVHCTRRGGRMIQVGLPIGGRPPSIPMGVVAGRELELVGSHGFGAEELPDLLHLVAIKRLQVKKLIEKEVGLKEGVRALMDMDQKSPLGMTVITSFDHSSRL